MKKAGGKVIDSWSVLKWPQILDKEPPAGLCECCCYFEATVDIQWKGSSWKDFLAANGFKRDNAIPILGDIPALAKLFNDPKDPNLYFSRDIDLPRLGSIEISASVSGKNLKARVMHLSISRFTRYYIRPDTTESKAEEPDKGDAKPADKVPPKEQPSMPLQYLINCLGVKKEGGKVIDSGSILVWPQILDKEPPVGTGHPFGVEATLDLQWKGSSWKDFLAANGFKRDGENIPQIWKLFRDPKKEVYYSRSLYLPRLGSIEITASVSGENGKEPIMHLSIGQMIRYYIRPDTTPSKPAEPDKGDTKPEDKDPPKDQPLTPAPEEGKR